MNFRIFFFSALLFGHAYSSDYTGNVGRLKAMFSLEFHQNGTVSGTYFYPGRPGVIYKLRGTNPEEGKLLLNEYTGNRRSARCVLAKRVFGGTITWEGRMFNTDGREFEMSFSRSRETTGSSVRVISADTIPGYWPFTPTFLNAHILGKVYFGSFGKGVAWCALVFDGEKAELQFSGAGTGWKKRILIGDNPESGVLRLWEGGKTEWRLDKSMTAEMIIWQGVDPMSGERLVFSRRRSNDFLNEDYRVVPESCRWMYTSDREQQRFYQSKAGPFPIFRHEGDVGAIGLMNGRVSSVVLTPDGKNPQVFRFNPPRLPNRIPVQTGMRVRMQLAPGGRVLMTSSLLGPHAHRIDNQGIYEVLMTPAPEHLGGRPGHQMVIRPDFFHPSSPAPFVGWWVEEDIIGWNDDTAGPGGLELESIDLDLVTPLNEDGRINPPAGGTPRPVSDWKPYPEWNWFYDNHLDPDGPRLPVPLQMRIWSAG